MATEKTPANQAGNQGGTEERDILKWIRYALLSGMNSDLILERIPRTMQAWRESGLGQIRFQLDDNDIVIKVAHGDGYIEIRFNDEFMREYLTTDTSLSLALKRILAAIVDIG